MPILTRYLEPEDFGKLAIFAAVLTLIGPLAHLALYSFISVEFFQKSKDHLNSVISNIVLLIPIVGLILSALLFISKIIFGNYLGLPTYCYLLIPLLAVFQNYKAITLSIYRNLSKAMNFGAVNITTTALNFGLSILLVIGIGLGWQGRVNAQIFASLFMGVVSIFLLKKEGYFSFKLGKKIVKENLAFSFPLIPSIFAISIINQIDRFFIKEIAGESALGMYAIGTSFGMIITFFLYSFEQIIVPSIYKTLSANKNKAANRKVLMSFTKFYGILVFVLAFLISAGSYLLLELNFLPEKYLSARKFIFWIAIAYALWGMCTMLTPYINFSKKTKYLLWATGIGCIINLVANYFFIHQYGAIGAAYSKVLTFGVVLVLYWYFGKKLMKMNWFQKGSFSFSKKEFLNLLG